MDEGDTAPQGAFWLIHLLLPLVLTFEEAFEFLHAGAVEIDGRPVLFIAPSMGGKSTLTDHFLQQGHPLITDDKMATFFDNDRFMAVTAHPYHRPYRQFEDLGHRTPRYMHRFKPIHGIYLLDKTDPEAAVSIDEVRGFAKFDLLQPHHLYHFDHLRHARMRYLSGLLSSVRLFRIAIPWDKARLSEVHHMLCRHSTANC